MSSPVCSKKVVYVRMGFIVLKLEWSKRFFLSSDKKRVLACYNRDMESKKTLNPKQRARYDAILEAALDMFAEYGFDATSTRQIAAAAGLEQGHLSYYFPSKDDLWREMLLSFQDAFYAVIDDAIAAAPSGPAVERARVILPPFLRHFAHHGKLARIMLQQFSVSSPRHDWVIDTFARPIWDRLRPLFEDLEAEGALAGIGAAPAYFTIVGAAVTVFGSSSEVQRLGGTDPSTESFVEGHIAFLLRALLPAAPSQLH
jgi:TetR/AcrR family transcriptional regulator